jgi:glycosyltransferase involved in cell wall biosynthesis
MKILYDHQAFSSFAYGGVSRIYFELMNAYSKDLEVKFKLSLKYTDNEYLKGAKWDIDVHPYLQRISYKGGLEFPVHIARNIIVKQINNYRKNENKRYSEKIIAQGEYDIFHPTYFDPYFLDHLHKKPFVLTVYDMIYELFPEYFPSSQNFLAGKSLLMKAAAKIIAISEKTKNDLMNYYHVPGDNIEVVYLASSLKNGINKQNGKNAEFKLPKNYLLYVGNRALYKNFLFFVESITPILLQDKTLSVVCAGGKNFTRSEKKLFHTLGVEQNLHYFPVNDEMLISLYKNALAFVFPSLYEGFGIPVLEAFACNCPVLISKDGALPEVAGDACLLFDPQDKNSIIDATNRIISDISVREELRQKGKDRGKLFSWERTANETKQIYKNIIQH